MKHHVFNFQHSAFSTAHLNSLLDAVTNLNIIVIGDAILDCYLEGFSDRLCREAPVPVVTVTNSEYVPGGAANTAVNVRSLGGKVTFISAIGDDGEGSLLCQALSRRSVPSKHLIVQSGRQTLAKQRVMASSQILVRFDFGTTDAIDEDSEQALIDELERRYPECDAAIVSDYGYGILTQRVIDKLSQLQARHNHVLVVDAKNLAAYRHIGTTAVKPNYEQVLKLLNIPPLKADNQSVKSRVEQILPYGDRILELTGATIAAVTLDAEGGIIFERGSQPHRTYTQPTIQSRTAGAGDTFVSALTLALAVGAATPLAADFAATAAAVVVGKDGTSVCSAEELREFLLNGETGEEKDTGTRGHGDTGNFSIQSPRVFEAASNEVPPQKYISDLNQLLALVTSYRKAGRKIVFTNGCFDILHAGHVSYLNYAKALGDILIVGLNSDNSIRRLKGSSRPINTLEDRIQVLSGLGCVDHLIAFEEDTPSNLIRIVRPDVFVKGGNYTKETLPEAPLVEQLGGEVRLLPFVENRSTTRIIERIRELAGKGIGD
ncbi:D-glycero-beta-D-manno-heptose 1-phosphate adenylyltransferase [Chlorogloeopsis fritschii PCC 9212]|uniref:Bifunctional protein HldE n=1 Tax=Chlorogloeopsis fritschii PCC 6912 TaxID=211165 RepID=A0A3S0XVJ8_CHLFR|nr:D-glycero-beta-D-manno-heptose 1-phosphate adenylyltransferase [Chlorogloeopsis fritschii]RUR81795.1 bifunctional protein HldE [Chlorogloeopsis fritschii PCC 6912]